MTDFNDKQNYSAHVLLMLGKSDKHAYDLRQGFVYKGGREAIGKE